VEKLKQLIDLANSKGIAVPMLRDPKTGSGSITATMFIITHIVAIVVLFGKVTKILGDVDYNSVLMLYGLSGSFYLGRKMSGDGKTMTVEGENKNA
jgi:hypothetical protein